MEGTTQPPPVTTNLDRLIELLGDKDRRLNRFAAGLLVWLGPLAVDVLAEEATKPRRKAEHRVRILEVVLQIGGPLGPKAYRDIATLTEHGAKKVHRKAEEVLQTLSPEGPPPLVPPEVLQPFMETGRRVAAAAAQMLEQATFRPKTPMVDWLIGGLAGEDTQAHETATRIFCRVGRPALGFLIQEACGVGKRPAYRVKVLEVIRQIGSPLPPKEISKLGTLVHHSDPAVRAKVVEVVTALRPRSPR